MFVSVAGAVRRLRSRTTGTSVPESTTMPESSTTRRLMAASFEAARFR